MNRDDLVILKNQTAILYQQALFSNATVIGVAILMYSLFSDHEYARWLMIWSVAISVIACLRLVLLYAYKRQQRGEVNPRIWIRAYVVLTFVVGVVWGSSSIFYVLIDDIQINTLFYVLISTVVAAAVPVLSAWFPAFMAYTLPQVVFLTSMSFYQIHTTDAQNLVYFLTFAFIAYFLLMVSLARRANLNIVQGLKLQQHNQHLLDKLNEEVAQREQMVQSRTQELVVANQKLKSSQAHMLKLSRAVESSPNPILITDANGIIEYVNKKCEQVSGFTATEVAGKELEQFMSYNVSNPQFDEIWPTVATEGEWHGELKNRKKDGSYLWLKVYLAAVFSDAQTVTNYVVIYEDITDSRRLAEKLSYQATHDDLTGLINRVEFENRLNRLVEDARSSGSKHALCFLDLDQFKVINDTCGHIAGDELLRQLGKLLAGSTRKTDTLARLGGDEFAILIMDCEPQQAEWIANEVREMVEQFQFIWESQLFTIGVSIGVTSIHQHTLGRTEVLKQADSACYAAKNSGRNRVYLYQERDKQLAQQEGEFKWVNEIKEAIMDNRLELFVQPIISTRSEHLSSYEVLVRLRSKAGQLFPPGAFLPSAERYNLSDKVDRWVIDHVFAWLEQHQHKLPFLKQLAINLSGASLGHTDMLAYISSCLAKASFKASMIKFEITETAAIGNLRNANTFIKALSEIGCQFSLDDFGSGLSSFGYLKNLPVQSIKIDGMFVKDMNTDPLDFEMVKSINDIGHVMGLETIAEFVEDEQIWDKLRSIGVDYGQGYHLGKPVPIDAILSPATASKRERIQSA